MVSYRYFDTPDDDGANKSSNSASNLQYQPGPNSPTRDEKINEDDDDEDELDAYMANIEVILKPLNFEVFFKT